MAILMGLKWNHFQGHLDLRESATTLRSKIDAVVSILKSKRDILKKDSSSKKRKRPFNAPPPKTRVPEVFHRKSTIQTSDNAFYVEVDSSFTGPKKKTITAIKFLKILRSREEWY